MAKRDLTPGPDPLDEGRARLELQFEQPYLLGPLVRRLRPSSGDDRGPPRRAHQRPRRSRHDRGRARRRGARARRADRALQPPRPGPGRRRRRGRGADRHGQPALARRHHRQGSRLAVESDDPHAQEDHRAALDRPDAIYGSPRPRRHDLRARAGGHGQDLCRGGAGGGDADHRPGRPADPVAPGGRGRRAARLPPRRHEGKGRSLSAPALRRALRHAPDRAGRAPHRLGRDRDRPDRIHARAHAERRVHHPRRGAEHHAAADEDVPHPLRHARADGDLRRSQPDRSSARPGIGPQRRRRQARGHLQDRHDPLRRRRRRPPSARRQDRRSL